MSELVDERLVVRGREGWLLVTAWLEPRWALGLLAHPDVPPDRVRTAVEAVVVELRRPVADPRVPPPERAPPGGEGGAPAELTLGARRTRRD